MTGSQQLILGEGAGGAAPTYIEDVFSTFVYDGNRSQRTINNGINLFDKGGLIWIKLRASSGGTTYSHFLQDSARGWQNSLSSNSVSGEVLTNYILAASTNGFELSSDDPVNRTTSIYTSWTFRKQPKFFDVVTYTGNGSNRTIAHNLGSVPGCIIVKSTDSSGTSWQVYHRSLANTQYLQLDRNDAVATGATRWNSTTPTSTVFSVGTDASVNFNGRPYVAYLFAHNAGGFGDSSTDNVISCGSFTADGSGNATVDLGYEPQWILLKRSSDLGDWFLVDNIRGIGTAGFSAPSLQANNQSNEDTGARTVALTSTGFNPQFFGNDTTWIYIAVRRGPMKKPTDATQVFRPVLYTGTNVNNRLVNTTIAPDMVFLRQRNSTTTAGMFSTTRMFIAPYLLTGSSGSQVDNGNAFDRQKIDTTEYGSSFTSQNGFWIGTVLGDNTTADNYIVEAFKRAPGFFDVVCYTGTGSARTVTHNLGVAPEMMIIKSREAARPWFVYHSGMVYSPYGADDFYSLLNTSGGMTYSTTAWNSTYPTSTVFSVGAGVDTNQSGENIVAYLFATCPGVSKVGSYTGTGSTLQINCGFTGGARFVLIKQLTGATGAWAVWDSARGIVAGNDPYLRLNSSDPEVTTTDWVDAYSLGFELSPSYNAFNVNTELYIYLAIA